MREKPVAGEEKNCGAEKVASHSTKESGKKTGTMRRGAQNGRKEEKKSRGKHPRERQSFANRRFLRASLAGGDRGAKGPKRGKERQEEPGF